MALEGCHACIKYTMFVFNILFWLIGCALLGVGIWLKVDPNLQQAVTNQAGDAQVASLVNASAWVLIIIGSIVLVIGFLGCCGAIRESQCLLTLFFIFMTIIFIVLLAIAIFLLFSAAKFKQPLKEEYGKYLESLIENYNASDNKIAISDIQNNFKCCGATNGLADYKTAKFIIEALVSVNPPCKPEYEKTPCANAMTDATLGAFAAVAIALIIICLIILIGMVFSMVLCCAIRTTV